MRLRNINAATKSLLGAIGLILDVCASQAFATSTRPVGQTTFTIGNVQARDPAGQTRVLTRGVDVYAGDTVITGANGAAQLRFMDESRMVLRRSTEVMIDQFQFSAEAEAPSDSFLVRLTSGALRSITGLIGHRNKQHFMLTTPVATIGIRGTDFEVVHIPDASPALFGAENSAAPGTYNKVYSGGTHLESKAGVIDLNINEIGFIGVAAGLAKVPTKIEQLPPGILKVIASSPALEARVHKPETPADEPPGSANNDDTKNNNSDTDSASHDPASTVKPDGTVLQDQDRQPTLKDGGPKEEAIKDHAIVTKLPVSPTLIDQSALQNIDPSTLKSLDSTMLKSTPLQTIQPAPATTLDGATTLMTAPQTTTTPLLVAPSPPITSTTITDLPATPLQVAPSKLDTTAITTLPTTTTNAILTTPLITAPAATTTIQKSLNNGTILTPTNQLNNGLKLQHLLK